MEPVNLGEILRNYNGAGNTPVTAQNLVDEKGPIGAHLAQNIGNVGYAPTPEGYPTPLDPNTRWVDSPDRTTHLSVNQPDQGGANPYAEALRLQHYVPDMTAKAPVQWSKVGQPVTMEPGTAMHYDTGPGATDSVWHELLHVEPEFQSLGAGYGSKLGISPQEGEHKLIDLMNSGKLPPEQMEWIAGQLRGGN